MRKKESPPETGRSKERRAIWLLLAGLVLIVLLAAVSCGGPSAEQRAEEPVEDKPAGGEEQATVDLEHPSLGDEGAPVVITEYADYQ